MALSRHEGFLFTISIISELYVNRWEAALVLPPICPGCHGWMGLGELRPVCLGVFGGEGEGTLCASYMCEPGEHE